MTFVVTDTCIKCKLTDCVEVCPVDCFHEGPNMLVIDPEECIDCTLCEPECPVEAIFDEDLAERIRRLPPAEQRRAIAFVHRLEQAANGTALLPLINAIPHDDLDEMAAAIEADCERVDAKSASYWVRSAHTRFAIV